MSAIADSGSNKDRKTVQTQLNSVQKNTVDTPDISHTFDIPQKSVFYANSETKDTPDKASIDVPEKKTYEGRSEQKYSVSKIDSNSSVAIPSKNDNIESKKDKEKSKSTSEKTSNNGDSNTVSTNETRYPPKEYHIALKHITQFSKMPTGCEIVSTKMVLDYYGKNLTYKDMLAHMPTENLKMSKNGKLYGKTPFQAFIGNPTKDSGFGCYPPVIEEMVANYNFSDLYTESTSNLPLDFISKTYLTQDIPVLVWVTIGMGESYLTDSWYIEDEKGKPSKEKYTWRAAEHCMVMVGYDKKFYYFCDPLSYNNIDRYEKKLVEKRYEEIGSYSLLIREYDKK